MQMLSICLALAEHLLGSAVELAGDFPALGNLESGAFLNPGPPVRGMTENEHLADAGPVRRANLGDSAARQSVGTHHNRAGATHEACAVTQDSQRLQMFRGAGIAG
jgi:hypothetical protein